MARYIGSIILGMFVSLTIIWLAAFLVREPASLEPHTPHVIQMPRLLEETIYLFPETETPEDDWWETGPRIECCCICDEYFGPPPQRAPFDRFPVTANILLPLARPNAPSLYSVTARNLLDGHWEPAVIAATYPQRALARELEGDVLVEATLAPDGSVSAATVITPGPNGQFDKAALEAVMAARFSPPMKDGQQVHPMTRRFLIRFRLPATA